MSKTSKLKTNEKKLNIGYLIICTALLGMITLGVIIISIKMLVSPEAINPSELIMVPVSLSGLVMAYIYILRVSGRDSLTRLYGVDRFTIKLVSKFIKRELPRYTVIYINLKDFKYINNKVSSLGGDRVIAAYAAEIRKFCHSNEIACRLGGDNFLLLISKHRIDELIKLLSNMSVTIHMEGKDVEVQVKSRCGMYSITDMDTVSDVFNKPSMAMNYAKQDSIDFCWFTPEMSKNLLAEKQISYEYDVAIKNGDLKVYYQPKVSLLDNRIVGCEGLVRWEKGDKVLLPADFLPALSKNARVAELDYYVLEQVCKDISECKNEGNTPVAVSTNFSMIHLKDADFARKVIEIINRYKVDRSLFQIELTESEKYCNMDALEQFLKEMHAASIKTAIDDFGIGFSSLELLKNNNVDVIKLDKRFVENIEVNAGENTDSMLLKNILKTCLDMKKEVVCEGVENKAQRDALIGMRCAVVQGFYYDKALTKEEFKKRLENPVYSDR